MAYLVTFPNTHIKRDNIITMIYIFHHNHLKENLSCVLTQRSFHKNLIFMLIHFSFSMDFLSTFESPARNFWVPLKSLSLSFSIIVYIIPEYMKHL
ncbi:hypothetical protein Bca4012_028522 [Brassica carinata]